MASASLPLQLLLPWLWFGSTGKGLDMSLGRGSPGAWTHAPHCWAAVTGSFHQPILEMHGFDVTSSLAFSASVSAQGGLLRSVANLQCRFHRKNRIPSASQRRSVGWRKEQLNSVTGIKRFNQKPQAFPLVSLGLDAEAGEFVVVSFVDYIGIHLTDKVESSVLASVACRGPMQSIFKRSCKSWLLVQFHVGGLETNGFGRLSCFFSSDSLERSELNEKWGGQCEQRSDDPEICPLASNDCSSDQSACFNSSLAAIHDFNDGGKRLIDNGREDWDTNGSNFSELFGKSSSYVGYGEQDDSSESEHSEKETDEAEDENDGNFGVLDLFDKERLPKEELRSVEEGEDVFRHPLVREVCRLIELGHVWSPKLEGEMRHLLRSLKPQQVCAVIQSQKDECVALNFFYWADRQWRYRHAPDVYYAMLEVLSKTKLCQGAKRVLRLMARRGIDCEPRAFRHLMISYSRAGKLRSAMRVLNMMQKAGCGPDLLVCNTAVHVLVMANRLEKALKFVDRMERVELNPDVVTYNCLIKGFCAVHRVEDALEVIQRLPFKGCSPDKISYYTVMNFLCKEKRIREVRELLQMMEKDHNLLPDQVTYYTLIHVLSNHGHADEALEFLQESERKGFRIDKVGYSAIVHSFCQEGRMDKAQEVVNEMFLKGCIPDVVTYSAVVNGFCRIGKVNQAKSLIQQMYKHGCKPNTVSYTALLNGICKLGNSLEAWEMLNSSEEEWWTPNAITFSVVMHGLRREGKLMEACDLVGQMLNKGFYPTPVEINQLIQAFCRQGKVIDAKKFVEGCISKGCKVNVVNFTTLIHGFCREGDLESALSLFDDMYLSNRHPDEVTYTTMIDALGRKGRFEEATELVNKMLKKGLSPTPVTYRTVIHHYCEGNKMEDLVMLLEKMQERKEFRTAYNLSIEKLCKFGNIEEAYKLLGKVLRTSSKIDVDTCHVLIDSCLKKDLPLFSYKVACRMLRRNVIPDVKLCRKVSNKLASQGNQVEAEKLVIQLVERGYALPQC